MSDDDHTTRERAWRHEQAMRIANLIIQSATRTTQAIADGDNLRALEIAKSTRKGIDAIRSEAWIPYFPTGGLIEDGPRWISITPARPAPWLKAMVKSSEPLVRNRANNREPIDLG